MLSQARVGHVLEHGAYVDAAQVDDEAGGGDAAARAPHLPVPAEVAKLGRAALAAEAAGHGQERVLHPAGGLNEHALSTFRGRLASSPLLLLLRTRLPLTLLLRLHQARPRHSLGRR